MPDLNLKLVVTGAGGRVGRMLVPLLLQRGCTLLLCGRDPGALAAAFPGVQTCGNDDLKSAMKGHDAVLHLAALNTDADADAAAMRAVNLDLTLDVALAAQAGGVPRFLFASSVHALDDRNRSLYAVSKREAAAALAQLAGVQCTVLHLATIHGEYACGALSVLNAMPASLARLLFPVLAALKPTLAVVRLADAVVEIATLKGQAEADDSVILTDEQDGNLVYAFVSRSIDLAFSVVVLVPLLWLLLIVGLFVRITSPGPAIFAQKRVGRFGKPFTCFKFRTMHAETRESPTHEAAAAAVTDIGRFLRRSKLDELPQAANIILGQMSLIGPRPSLLQQEELVEERRKRRVLDLRPGISGYSQVQGIDMSDPVRLARMDARYRALRCLLLDLRIILATLTGRGFGDNVGELPPGSSLAVM